MSFVTNNYYYFFEEDATKEILSLLKQIRMTQEQLVTELANLQAQTEKAKTEVLAKIASLENAISAAGNVTPEVEAALAELKTSVQGVDDIVPDEVPQPPVETPA